MLLKIQLFLLVLYFSGIQGFERKGYPDYKYHNDLRGWTKLHDKPANWKTASENCQKEGAVLLSTSSKKLNDALELIIEESKKPLNVLYIGAKTVYLEDKHCMVFITNNSTTNSVNCNQEHPHVCFALVPKFDSAVNGLAFERKGYPDYKPQKYLHGWTKLHDKPANWKTASENCQKEGAVLVSSASKNLIYALNKIIEESKKSINILYIGAKIVYSGVTSCKVYITYNSTMSSVDCNQEHPYVCFALAPKFDCEMSELGQDREGYPGYNRCSKVKGWLKLHVEPADFNTAQQRCEKEGASLIFPWDEEFKKAAFKLIQSNNTDDNLLLAVHSGGQVVYPYGGFLDEDDGNLKYYKELATRCIVFKPDGSLQRTACQQEFAFICYAPFAKYHCGDKDHVIYGKDYELDPRTGHCYKIDIYAKTWNKSRESCQKEGGDLAVINSPEEAKFLETLYAKHTTFVNTYCTNELFVGFHEPSIGIWKTIEGETLEEAGYAGWGQGKPANRQADWPDYVKGVRQTCGAMDRKGRLSDCWCKLPHAHICEKMATVIPGQQAAFSDEIEDEINAEN